MIVFFMALNLFDEKMAKGSPRKEPDEEERIPPERAAGPGLLIFQGLYLDQKTSLLQ